MKHEFSFLEIGYDLEKNIKEYFCKNCQKKIAEKKHTNNKLLFLKEWERDCKGKQR